MSVHWLDISFPTGLKRLDRDYGMVLPEHHYPGAPGDAHEDMGDRAMAIRAEAELMTTYDSNGAVDRTAEQYFEDLQKAREQRKPDTLFLDNGASHHVWLRNVRRDDSRGPNLITVSLEFVETLDDSLRLVKIPPQAEEALDEIKEQIDKIEEEAVEENIPVDKKKRFAKWKKVKALYKSANDFAKTARAKINDITQRVTDVRNLGANAFKEFERLSADIAELVYESQTLFNDLATDPFGTFAICRSVRKTINNLRGIGLLFAPPPRDRGQVAKTKISGRVTTHTVAEGESLQQIAQRQYGSAALWTVVADANDVGDPMAVEPGTELVIPDVPPEQVHGTCKVRPQIFKAEF